jgi:hypothetical protein
MTHTRSSLRTLASTTTALVLAALAPASITVTGFPVGTTPWGSSDATLGIAGPTWQVENFEDRFLLPNLRVRWTSPAGNFGPTTYLPNIYTQGVDANGSAFVDAAWDGTGVLINTRTNQSFNYAATTNWGDVEFVFDPPVRAAGFSIQQLNFPARIIVNGVDAGDIASLPGFSASGGRQGYVRIDATGADRITSLRIDNAEAPPFAFSDGLAIDHLAWDSNVPGRQPNLLVNGDFELPNTGFISVPANGTQSGWTVGSTGNIEFVDIALTNNPGLVNVLYSAYSGRYWVDLVGVQSPSSIRQSVQTEAGRRYELRFAVSGNVWGPSFDFAGEARFNNQVVGSWTLNRGGFDGTQMNWQIQRFVVTGTGGLDSIELRATTGGSFRGPAIDSVTFRALVCGLSDVAGANQTVGSDGVLTADDIIVFLSWFFAADARANIAGPNQSDVPDNAFTADDIILFLGRYFNGCE